MGLKPRLILVTVLYLVSLPLPALPGRTNQPEKTFASGASIGAVPGEWGPPGWFCVVFVPFVCIAPAWWANPCLLIGGICLAKGAHKAARNLGFVALGLAVTFPIQGPLLFGKLEFFPEFPLNVLRYGSSLGPGYYVWLASIAGLLLSTRKSFDLQKKPGEDRAFDEI